MGRQKQTVVSFRVDQHLAEVLNALPDKSSFIRDAILQRFHTACPFCEGRGVLPLAIAEWLQARLPDFEEIECDCCHFRYPAELAATYMRQESGEEAPVFTCPHCQEHGHGH
jgi:hypothetical protein